MQTMVSSAAGSHRMLPCPLTSAQPGSLRSHPEHAAAACAYGAMARVWLFAHASQLKEQSAAAASASQKLTLTVTLT